MKYKLLGCLLLVLVYSCSQEESLLTSTSDTAVIEGYIYANQLVDSIRITQSIAYAGDGSLNAIDDLSVSLNNGPIDIPLESIGDGYYRNRDHIIQEDVVYTISFDYNDETVSGTTYVNPTINIEISANTLALDKIEFTGNGGGPGGGRPQIDTELQNVEVTWDNKELSYYFVDVENIEPDPEYVNGIFEFFEEQGIERPQRFFRSEPSIVDSYSLDTRRELQFFGTYEITVYRLNAEYAALYESVGSSTLSLDEPPTNIENGLGIFTAITPHKVILEVI